MSSYVESARTLPGTQQTNWSTSRSEARDLDLMSQLIRDFCGFLGGLPVLGKLNGSRMIWREAGSKARKSN